MDYGFAANGRVYTPNGSTVSPEENEERNSAIESAELAHWATKPARMGAYITEKPYASTWLGTNLGLIVERSTHRHNFGRHSTRITHVRVRGTNGAMYYGAYGSDWAEYVMLRRAALDDR